MVVPIEGKILKRLNSLELPDDVIISITDDGVTLCVKDCFESANELMIGLYPLIRDEGYELSYKKTERGFCVHYLPFKKRSRYDRRAKTTRKFYKQLRDR